MRAHALEFNVIERRPYDIWVRANLVEFLVGMGACPGGADRRRACPRPPRPGRGLDRLVQPAPLVTLSLVAVVLATDLIGVNRGEVIRLWIFLACFLQIPAAVVCARAGRRALAVVLVTTLLLSALGTANIGFVVPG